MTLAFLVLYPLGIYFLRSGRTTAFNLHWTINSLASVCVSVGAVIGFINSRSIRITHQYLGILLVCGLAVQTVLGWRHHIIYISHLPTSNASSSRRRGPSTTWMAQVHVWLGRVVLPLGMLNVISGLLLRHYGWLTIALTIAVTAVEIVALVLVVGRAKRRQQQQQATNGAGHKLEPMRPSAADEAEEYFQLTVDDDEFSDENDEEAATGRETESETDRARRQQEEEKREQQRRLARLDKV